MGQRTTDKPENKTAVSPTGEQKSVAGAVDAFLTQAKSVPVVGKQGNGRLIFAMDATMSRQPSWDTALQTQAEMFSEAGNIGGLDVQLVYFRGFGECRASKWVGNADALARLMTGVECRGGNTQIKKVLNHVRREAQNQSVDAVVYVGDCMEENVDELCRIAGELGLLGVKVFMFQEGNDAAARTAFQEIARLTGGAYSRFDASSVRTLRELLGAAAAYAAGGRAALEAYSGKSGAGVAGLLGQLD